MSEQLQLGWVIVYVDAPREASEFYAQAFGLKPEFESADGAYAQLATGPTRLAFTSYQQGEHNFAGGVARNNGGGQPVNVEITLVANDVDAAFDKAVASGCTPLAEPKDEPRGQRVAWVRDPFGTLVELGTPM
jgi:predicted enzyme related to lactoylglutathione lyase